MLLRRALELCSAATLAGALARGASATEACVEPSSESLRESLRYVAAAADPAKACAQCGFFTAQDPKSACGQCAIMSGPVHATGHCESWSAKS
jgi:hypothetical protein